MSGADTKTENGLKILLIEDTPLLRKLLVTILRGNNYTVMEAANGEEALTKLSKERPDAILCDLSMPVMDGRAFIQKFRSQKSNQNIPIVVLSAEDHPDLEAELRTLGANGIIDKTTNHAELIKRLQAFLPAKAVPNR